MRRAHFLRQNRNVEIPSNVIVLDTETRSTEIEPGVYHAQLWFGYAMFTRRYRGNKWTAGEWLRFEHSADLWNWVESRAFTKRKLYVFSHNLGFDSTVTQAVRQLQSRGWDLKGAIIDDPPTVLRYRKDRRSIVLMDSLNLFRMSLAQVGEFTESPKLPMPPQGAAQGVWDAYCRNDVTVLYRALRLYWEQIEAWDLGNFQYTLPAQAFGAFRHRFMQHSVFVDDKEESHVLSRAAYMGGRVECFRLGRIPGRVHCVDINSQYPFVMRDQHTPTRLVTVFQPKDQAELIEQARARLLVAQVEIDIKDRATPVKHEGKLLFPLGRTRTVLATPELLPLLLNDDVIRVGRVAVYERAKVFTDYVDFFWGERQRARAEGNRPKEWICKLFLNSLAGKWGQNGRVYEDVYSVSDSAVKTWCEWDVDTQTLRQYRQIGGLVQEQLIEGESRDSFPAIAAHITSAARTYLWQLIVAAGIQNVYYCDTDSLFVNDEGLEKLRPSVDPGTLGALKHEWSSERVIIHGPKDYEVDGVEKIKGVRKNAELLRPGHYRQDLFRGFRGMLQAGDLDRMLISKTEKHLVRQYSKGRILPDGRVLPLRAPLDLVQDLESADLSF